jgi:tetratricopeptide (TPR) repeat protein
MRLLIIHFKLMFLYVTYWLVGSDEEGFQWQKGNLLADLGYFHEAIYALKKAKKDLNTSYMYGSLGWCYLQIEDYERALVNYQVAHTRRQSPEIIWGLAIAELRLGNYQKATLWKADLQRHRELPHMKEWVDQFEEEFTQILQEVSKVTQ